MYRLAIHLLLAFSAAVTAIALLPAQDPSVEEKRYTPYDCVRLALADAEAVAALHNDDELDIRYCRYLALNTVSKERRKILKLRLDFLVNSLNTKYPGMVRMASLPAGSNDPIVLRINLNDYGINPAAWDYLAENGSGSTPIPDPYYHAFIIDPRYVAQQADQVPDEQNKQNQEVNKSKWHKDEYGWYYFNETNRKVYIQGTPPINEIKPQKKAKPKLAPATVKKLFVSAPWIAFPDKGVSIARLGKLTYTRNPILNGLWFLTYAAWSPAYYQFIGIKTKPVLQNGTFVIEGGEKEFEQLVKFDRQAAKNSLVSAIADSKIVTLHNRILLRFPTTNAYIGGYYWFSNDTDKGIDAEDYINTLANFDNAVFKAKEIIASTPNQLQIYAVADNKGNLLSVAQAGIAIHGEQMPTKLQDKQVYAGVRNCALCHNEGMVNITDKVRNFAQGDIALLIAQKFPEELRNNKELVAKIKSAFKPPIGGRPNELGITDFDKSIHKAALLAVNGLTPQENKNGWEDLIVDYYDGYITLEKAAQEAGWPTDRLERALKGEGEYKGFGVGLDYTLTALLQKAPAENVLPSRLPWERQGHAALMTYLMALQQIRPSK